MDRYYTAAAGRIREDGMSDLLTVCTVKADSNGYGFAHWGRMTRAEAIELTRKQAERDLLAIQTFLATPVDQLCVRVVRGSHAQRLVEELKP